MTINITLTMPSYIIQVSDRRMVSMPSGKIYDDEANKGVVVKSDDGIFSVIFSGIGKYGKQRVDLWLADQMLKEGIPELRVRDASSIIAKYATDWFKTFPHSLNKLHTFTLAGWESCQSGLTPVVWRITNCITEDGKSLNNASEAFNAWEIPIRSSSAGLFVSGLTGIISRQAKASIFAALRAHANPTRMEEVLVDIIRQGASDPKWSWGINNNVLSILLANTGEIQATHHTNHSFSRYIPPILWYEAGRDYIAGDSWITSSQNKVFQFGPMLFASPPSNPCTEEEAQVDFHFKYFDAKYKMNLLVM